MASRNAISDTMETICDSEFIFYCFLFQVVLIVFCFVLFFFVFFEVEDGDVIGITLDVLYPWNIHKITEF